MPFSTVTHAILLGGARFSPVGVTDFAQNHEYFAPLPGGSAAIPYSLRSSINPIFDQTIFGLNFGLHGVHPGVH